MTDTPRERLVQLAVETIMNLPDLCNYADRIARQQAGVKYWNAQDFERNEDTAQYDLYWSVYAAVQGRIALDAAKELIGRHD